MLGISFVYDKNIIYMYSIRLFHEPSESNAIENVNWYTQIIVWTVTRVSDVSHRPFRLFFLVCMLNCCVCNLSYTPFFYKNKKGEIRKIEEHRLIQIDFLLFASPDNKLSNRKRGQRRRDIDKNGG